MSKLKSELSRRKTNSGIGCMAQKTTHRRVECMDPGELWLRLIRQQAFLIRAAGKNGPSVISQSWNSGFCPQVLPCSNFWKIKKFYEIDILNILNRNNESIAEIIIDNLPWKNDVVFLSRERIMDEERLLDVFDCRKACLKRST